MELKNALFRTARGIREDLRLHLLTILSLVVAFLCLGTAVLGVENLTRIGERWGHGRNLTVYLRDGSRQDDLAQLQLALEGLPEVATFKHVTEKDAQADFLKHMGSDLAWNALPASTFPASFEMQLRPGTSESRVLELAQRIAKFDVVDDVETYKDWFSQRDLVLRAGRSATGLLALLVAVCVIAVISHTIRLSVNSRRDEIEVLRMCGATSRYVHSPFLLEGAFHGVTSSALAVLLLLFFFLSVQSRVNDSVLPLVGVTIHFLQPLTVIAMVAFAGLVGGLGSALAVRRHIGV